MNSRRSIAWVISIVMMLFLLALLAGCGPEPTPAPPTPLPTSTPSATATPTLSPTPSATIVIKPLEANPRIGTLAAQLAAPLNTVVDGVYCSGGWSDKTFPSTIALPVGPVKGDLLLEWTSDATSDYVSAPGAPTYGIPASYTISTSADSTDGHNGSWKQVVSVTGNTARTREHRFPFAGARWLQMTVTGAVPGPLGNTFAIDEIDLHDASNGTDDSVFFLGDSITEAAFMRCPSEQPSFAQLVHQAFPARFPAMVDGGVAGINSSYGVSVIRDWLALNPDFEIWAIGYGTNDAWQKVEPSVFEANLQSIIDKVKAAERIPIIARIPYASKGPDDADVRALNEVIDRVTGRNRLVPGPDLYAWFKAHPDELGPDGVHPTSAGSVSINRLWYQALRPFYSQ